jgi:uncharacterized membrane protein YgdD (TMEM256/DUF423 family)
MIRIWLCTGAVYGLVAVMLGAFGAHGLRARLTEDMLRAWQTGVEYQFYHAFAVLLTGLLLNTGQLSATLGHWAAGCFVVGVLLFSGSLYGLALGGPRLLGPVTPIGGLLLMVGWLCLVVSVLRSGPNA